MLASSYKGGHEGKSLVLLPHEWNWALSPTESHKRMEFHMLIRWASLAAPQKTPYFSMSSNLTHSPARQVALFPFHRCIESGYFVVNTSNPFPWPDATSRASAGRPLVWSSAQPVWPGEFPGLRLPLDFKSWGVRTVCFTLHSSPQALCLWHLHTHQQLGHMCWLAHFDLKETVLPKLSFPSRSLWLPVISLLCSSISL